NGRRGPRVAPCPDGPAGFPTVSGDGREPAWLAATGKTPPERPVLRRNLECDLTTAEPHCAPPVPGDGRSRALTGNTAFAFAEHVIDGGRDRREPACGVCSGDDGVKAVGELLSEEAGRELSRLPPLVLHQRREERKVMAETFDGKRIDCVGLGRDRFLARRRMRYELRYHGIVIERNLTTLINAGVDAHGYAIRT